MTAERDIQADILGFLARHPAVLRAWRQNAGAVGTSGGRVKLAPAGTSDICGVMRDGRALQIEVKTKAGKVSREQAEWLADCLRSGAVAGVCRSVDDALALVSGTTKTPAWETTARPRGSKW